MADIVFSGVGHGGSDPGTSGGGVVEKTAALNIALAAREVLVRHGLKNPISRTKDENDPVMEEVWEANKSGAKIAVEYHLNAGGGDGFECFYSIHGGLGKTLAKNIEAEVIKIGQNSRGCKTKVGSDGRDYYAFIRETAMHAVICEFAFLDNPKDVQIIDTIEEQRAMGVAVAKGVLKTLGIAYQPLQLVEKHRNIVIYPAGSLPDQHCAEFFNLILNHRSEDCICVSDKEYALGTKTGKSKYTVGGAVKGIPGAVHLYGTNRYSTAQKVLEQLSAK